jgi:hypothetical protein
MSTSILNETTALSSNDEYNVIVCRCITTGEKFIAVRKESLSAYEKRTNNSAWAPSSATTLHLRSIRVYGGDNHTFTLDSTWATKAEANARKVELLARVATAKAGTLCLQVPRLGVPEMFSELATITENKPIVSVKTLDGVVERTDEFFLRLGPNDIAVNRNDGWENAETETDEDLAA